MNIRKWAKGKPCTAQLPGCRWDARYTVLAHAPHPRKGMGIKGPDTWGATCCDRCHDALDGRVKWAAPESKSDVWLLAIARTQDMLIQDGVMPGKRRNRNGDF